MLEFEKWIEPEVALMAGCVDRLLSSTGVSARDIDHVFLTGGSSFVPAVRNIFVERFGVGEDYGRRRADVRCDRLVAVRRQTVAGVAKSTAGRRGRQEVKGALA